MQVPRKIVLTGGPCAGKTTVTEVIARVFGSRVAVVPESASLLFRGGFPRWDELGCRRAAQSAIYEVQLNLEAAYSEKYPDRILILDRGTLDGAAYWPDGTSSFLGRHHTTLEDEISRYDQVIYLESADQDAFLKHKRDNPSRTESWEEARALDHLARELWSKHPLFRVVKNECSFRAKIFEVLALLERALEPELAGQTAKESRRA